MNMTEARQWIQERNVLNVFMAHFDGLSTVLTPMFTIIAEYVPTDFNPKALNAMKKIKEAGGLPGRLIHSVAFLKNPNRRTPGQMIAHMTINKKDIEVAHKMLRDGLFLAGKWVTTYKDIKEPPRCFKCHSMEDDHFAVNCKVEKKACGFCGKDYRSSQCLNHEERWCMVCKAAGHGAGDRTCGYWTKKVNEWWCTDPEAAHKYFVTTRICLCRRR
ncbi:hypothetical protein BDN71DRAFT_1393037 [Pleurotus eryngii]|uniref:Uncharacterized protein n=1 Tax=Pleurotus eryngii TaxID=5323 RepID=A0A9P5ZVD8_PLEER|nr:hypothetical protein BDN71DRAFT_1393037 [Pleurotus eryngii]